MAPGRVEVARRRAVRAACAVLVAAAAAVPGSRAARAQDAPARPPDQLSEAEVHRLRGAVAWRRAVWRVESGWFSRPVTELGRAWQLGGGRADFTTLWLLGFSHLRQGRVEDSRAPLREAAAIAPAHAALLLTDAIEATLARRNDDALRSLDEYVAAAGRYRNDSAFGKELEFLGRLYRGNAYYRLRRFDAALADLQAAMALARAAGHVPAAELVTLTAQTHEHLDEYEAAERLLYEALARDPAEATHYFNLGVLCAAQKRYQESKRWYAAAAARRPDFAEAHVKLAYLADLDHDLAGMRAHLETCAAIHESRTRGGAPLNAGVAADVAAGFGMYWRAVGIAREEGGDDAGAREAFGRAKTHLAEALAHQPGCVRALDYLIELGYHTGEPDSTIERYKEQLRRVKERGEEVELYRSTFC